MRRLTFTFLLASMIGSLATACGPSTEPDDGGDEPRDGGRPDGDGGVDPTQCGSDSDCGDGQFCTGVERCAPSEPEADEYGCVAAADPCESGEVCDEDLDECIPDCGMPLDQDGDGHRSLACGGDDCEDDDANRYPGNVEVCDGAAHDEDCNTDTFGFLDADGDGSASGACCNGIVCGEDCNDADSTVNPRSGDGPPLYCDGVDNDCSTTADEGCPCVEGETRDCGTPAQISGLGLCRPGVQVCSGGAWTADCIGGVTPQPEACDEEDNDCDATIDEGVLRTYFTDADGDGFGASGGTTVSACSPPSGHAANESDCDDAILSVNPLATEVCNGRDDDCDAATDEGVRTTYYRDGDGDGFGNATMSTEACSRPSTHVDNGVDCDDGVRTINPPAAEVCDGVDNNCDGATDVGCECTDGATQPCGPSDGMGGILTVGICETGSQRCQGGVWGICVGATAPRSETCNGADDDCDGAVDDDGVRNTYYADTDGDGFGNGAAPTQACNLPAGHAFLGTDCNDGSAAISPIAPEVCDGIDNNCSTAADEGCSCINGATRACGTTEVGACSFGEQLCIGGLWGACVGGVIPQAESCNGIDDNCDGGTDEGLRVTCYGDADDDTWAVASAASEAFCPVPGRAAEGGCPIYWTNRTPSTPDCADDDPARSPGHVEVCDGDDEDCDADIDEDTLALCSATGAYGACLGGSCGIVRCHQDRGDCDGNRANGCETNTRTSSAHCGGCGQRCGGGQCVNGLCENVVGVAPGGLHGCAWLASGRASCWGENGFGQLGDGTTVDRLTPGQVPSLASVAQMALGADHSCSRDTAGVVRCWGAHFQGQLGVGGVLSGRLTPEVVTLPATAVDLGVGSDHSCAALSSGAVYCWGGNFRGKLGNGNETNQSTPVQVTGLTGAVRVAGGGLHSCAVRTGGGVRCWGNGDEGQLGDGNSTSSSTFVIVSGITDATDVVAMGNTSCALRSTGQVACWGHNASGQLGLGGMGANVPTPVTLTAISGATAIAAGDQHVCALITGGQVRCWGVNASGQLGTGNTNNSGAPLDVPGLDDAVAIGAHGDTTCAIRSNGRLLCWGGNEGGELGDGSLNARSSPGPVVGIMNVVQLSTVGDHTCARYSTGRAACWGRNHRGQLGDGTADPTVVPVLVSGLVDAIDVSSGTYASSCAVRATNQGVCWGDQSAAGQLGNGGSTPSFTPVNVTGLTDALQIGAGASACARRQDNHLECWGFFFSPTATEVSGLTDVVELATGHLFRCVLHATGRVSCWGANQSGQVGNGAPDNTLVTVPYDVGISDAVAVTAGREHACALHAEGTVSCWGRNTSGQLGDGTLELRSRPSSVLGLDLVTEIEAGGDHTCARRLTGQVFCWGANDFGQIGDGTTTDRLAPISVAGLGIAHELALGEDHTCVRLSGQRTGCWGRNNYGQLGDGTNDDAPSWGLVEGL